MGSAPTLEYIQKGKYRAIAEIGVDSGRTSLQLARYLNNEGFLYLFDYEDKVNVAVSRLRAAGYQNVFGQPNSPKKLDSYNWSLMKLLQANRVPIFDYIYIDGAHTWFHDALAFFLCDKLLHIGGVIDFDDYDWCHAISPTVNPSVAHWIADDFTNEQIESRQIAMVIDILVKRDPRYVPVVENRIYRKTA